MERILTQTFGVIGALLEKEGKFLLVREAQMKGPDHGKWSHPAGWIEVGEDPLEGVCREVQEESGYEFVPTHILGVYSLVRRDIEHEMQGLPHAIKIIFLGTISEKQGHALHDDVSEARWFSPEEIYEMDQAALRDLDIKQMIRDYSSGQRFPLDLLTHTVSTK